MVSSLVPVRGGFIKPFGCGWFIREFLLGHGSEGYTKIDPHKGVRQADIFYYYKLALHRAYAQDAVDFENERRISHGSPIYSEDEYRERVDHLLSRIPYKLSRCRYHSFSRYFHFLKQLKWVEFTGREEAASIQSLYPNAPPRRFYRLTRKGIRAPDHQWSNPQLTLYPERGLKYYREKRKQRTYSRIQPTKMH